MRIQFLLLWTLITIVIPSILSGQEKQEINIDFRVSDTTIFKENFSPADISDFENAAKDSLFVILNEYIGLFQFTKGDTSPNKLIVLFQPEVNNGDPYQSHVLKFTFYREGVKEGSHPMPFLNVLDVMALASVDAQIQDLGEKLRAFMTSDHTTLVKKLFITIKLSEELLYLGLNPKPEWVLPFVGDSLYLDEDNSIFWIRVYGSDSFGTRDEYPFLIQPSDPYNPQNTDPLFTGCIRARLTSSTLLESKDRDDIQFNHDKYELFIFKYARKKELNTEIPSISPSDLANIIEPPRD